MRKPKRLVIVTDCSTEGGVTSADLFGDQLGGEGKSRSKAGGPRRSDTHEMRRGEGGVCQSLRPRAALRPGQSVGEPQSKDCPREDFPVRKDGLSFPNQASSVMSWEQPRESSDKAERNSEG